MSAPLVLTLTVDRSEVVALGRQITRLYKTANATEFGGHAVGTLVCARLTGRPDRPAGAMIYSLELRPLAETEPLRPLADWSLLQRAVPSESGFPVIANPSLPPLSHSPGAAHG